MALHAEDESRWIEQSREGSTEAFSQLVLVHQVRVRGYVGRFLRNPDLVDDLAQEVFLTAFRRLHTYRADVPFAMWILGIARYSVLEYLRGEMRRRSRIARLEAALTGRRIRNLDADRDALDARDLELSALQTCIGDLPEHSASLINEHYYQARTAGEIARRRGDREGTVRMTLLRIRQALRRCIEQKLAVEGGA